MVTRDGPGVFGSVKDGFPEVGWAILQFHAGQEPQAPAVPAVGADKVQLSPRETEVLHLLAAGRRNNQIAADLMISPSTVAKHVMSIYRKTETANRAEVTAFAYRHHLI
jgi:DNA-binding CsgD family transcriptional regulator